MNSILPLSPPSAPRFGHVSATRADAVGRDSARPTRSRSVRFGADTVELGNSPPVKKGLWAACRETLGALRGVMADRTNRLLVSGFGLQMGLPALLGLSLLAGPIGWLVSIVGVPITLIGNWYGEKLTQKAFEEIDARGLSKGRPLDRLAKMNDIWYNTTPETAPTWRQHYNRFIKDILGDPSPPPTPGAPPRSLGAMLKTEPLSLKDKFRRMITLHPRSRAGAVLDAALAVKAQYKVKWYARMANTLTEWCHRLPGMKPVALALSLAFHTVFLLLNRQRILHVMAHHARRAV